MHLITVKMVMFNRQFFIYLDWPSIGVSLNISMINRNTILTKKRNQVIMIHFCRFRATSNFCSLYYFEQYTKMYMWTYTDISESESRNTKMDMWTYTDISESESRNNKMDMWTDTDMSESESWNTKMMVYDWTSIYSTNPISFVDRLV